MRLQDLRGRHLAEQGEYQAYYVELSGIIRRYIEERFSIRAPEMTTEEFLRSLGSSAQLESEHRQLLADFLNACDMVKFARYGPSLKEAEEAMGSAEKFVAETREA